MYKRKYPNQIKEREDRYRKISDIEAMEIEIRTTWFWTVRVTTRIVLVEKTDR